MERKPGYYLLKYKGAKTFLRHDGHVWYFGSKICHPNHLEIPEDAEPLDIGELCAPNCVCTYNPDGTIHSNC